MRPAALVVLTLGLHTTAAVSAKTRPIKRSIVQLARGTQNGLAADAATAAQIGALSKLLEEANPTKPLATSDKIDGKWQLVYTSTKGGSAGKIGPFVGRVEQHFNLAQGRYSNFVHLGPAGINLVTGELKVRAAARRAPTFLGNRCARMSALTYAVVLYAVVPVLGCVVCSWCRPRGTCSAIRSGASTSSRFRFRCSGCRSWSTGRSRRAGNGA